MKLPFAKTVSIGNDFVLIRLEDFQLVINPPQPEGSTATAVAVDLSKELEKLAIKVCDRHFGVGSDGLLTVEKTANGIAMRMFNPDGTEDFCGNGLRCAAQYAIDEAIAVAPFLIQHGDQKIPVTAKGGRLSMILGSASYDPERVPVESLYEMYNVTIWSGMVDGFPMTMFGSALTTGSTHVVFPVADLPDDETFKIVSSRLEKDLRFAKGTSVIWSQEVGPNEIKIRIWERGVGETQGCGTGSSAAATDYLRRKDGGGTVTVHNPGGDVLVTMSSWTSAITIEGEAKVLYKGIYY